MKIHTMNLNEKYSPWSEFYTAIQLMSSKYSIPCFSLQEDGHTNKGISLEDQAIKLSSIEVSTDEEKPQNGSVIT
jgi:hypothetical protein